MQISIEKAVLDRYPGAQIGFLLAQVTVHEQDPYVEELKLTLLDHLHGQGINATNFAVHPRIALWREVYERDFHLKAKTYRSSVEALLKRVVTGKEIWSICNVVDLYNCMSILSLFPMGGYDLDKISGNIEIRGGHEGETFIGLGEREPVQVMPNQIVYADEQRVLCWLWNHKDSAETCIDETTKNVLFFIDAAALSDPNEMQKAVKQLSEHLTKIGGVTLKWGILNNSQSQVEL